MALSRIANLIADIDDIPVETVEIPEWQGVKVEIRGMDGHRRSEYLARLVEAQENEDPEDRKRDLARVECELIVRCTYDPEDGNLAFSDEDIPILMDKSGAVINRLSLLAQDACGLSAQTRERLGKGSLASVKTERPVIPSEGSTSTSP